MPTVRLFARTRDLAGADSIQVDAATVAELRTRLREKVPALEGLLPRCAIAVNESFADDAQSISNSDEIALIPPVSGG